MHCSSAFKTPEKIKLKCKSGQSKFISLKLFICCLQKICKSLEIGLRKGHQDEQSTAISARGFADGISPSREKFFCTLK